MENKENFNNEMPEESKPEQSEQEQISPETELQAEPSLDDFDFTDNGFAEQPVILQKREEKPKREKRGKRKKVPGWIKIVIWIVSIVIISVSIASVLIIGTGEYLGIGAGRGKECVIEIEQGMSTREIAHLLKEGKAINNELAFRIFSKLKGYDGKYLYGVYTFNNEIGYEDLADLLMTEGAKAESVTVTIPERSTIDEIAKILEEKGVCSASDFKSAVNNTDISYPFLESLPEEKVYYRLEGYLFPDTYDFYCYDSKKCAELAVRKMLEKMEEIFDSKAIEKAQEMGYTVHEILTMASIVELEASGNEAESAKVAQVFYNRLNNPLDYPTLGSSPTRKYPYGNGKYNTYECKGLPVGPMCAPSLISVKAALYPDTTVTQTYFVTDAKMNFYYTSSLSEHNAIISKLQRENNWIYED